MAKPQVEKDTSERWTVTYADLMNLLLILFIILYSMSKLDAEKSQQVQQSLGTGFSNMVGAAAIAAAGGNGGAGGTGQDANTYWVEDEYGQFYNEISLLIQNSGLQDKIDAKVDDTGIIISFKDSALFISGSADLSDEAKVMISQIGSLLSNLTYSFILVEGHTDSDPIIGGGRYQDNMDLSSARAGNVWRELVKCGIPPKDMASIGYGEYRPVAPNDTLENKSKNRRVVISILKMPFTASTDLVANNLPKDDSQASPNASQNPGESSSPSENPSPSGSPSPSESSDKSKDSSAKN